MPKDHLILRAINGEVGKNTFFHQIWSLFAKELRKKKLRKLNLFENDSLSKSGYMYIGFLKSFPIEIKIMG